MARHQDLADALISGDFVKSKKITQKLVQDGVSASEILDEGLFPGMKIIGKRFKADEIYLPEVLAAAYSMNEAMDILKPLLLQSDVQTKGTIVLGTVLGDIHNVGKNIVGMLLEGGGFKVIDVGVDVPAEKFVEEVNKNNAELLALSTLLTTTVPAMRDAIKAIRADKKAKDVKIMVGGVPLNQEYADSIGADGYGPEAGSAMDLAEELLK